MALWKARSLSPEQKVQIVEEESETTSIQTEDSGSFLGLDDVSMSEVYSSVLSVPVSDLSLFCTCNCICLPSSASDDLITIITHCRNCISPLIIKCCGM